VDFYSYVCNYDKKHTQKNTSTLYNLFYRAIAFQCMFGSVFED